jgi:hypothetical protein
MRQCVICGLPAAQLIDHYGSWINACDLCAAAQAKLQVENILTIERNLECRRRNYDERQQRGGVR